MDPSWLASFRDKLDQHHAWPTEYVFKFIVPKGKEEAVRNLFPLHNASEKESKKGNYISFTIQKVMPSGEAVIEIYQKAALIEGIIAL